MIQTLKEPQSEGLKFVSPLDENLGWWKLMIPFLKLMFTKEGLLPDQILAEYLNGHIKKKDIFLKSALQFGTPQYFYDQPNLLNGVRRFHQAFSRNVPRYSSFYALKSNCFPLILHDVVTMGMGLDASSGRELHLALRTDSKKILFSGPGKTDEELLLALNNCDRVILLIDCFNELSRLADILQNIKPGLNLNVGVRVRNNKKGQWDKFGIPLQDLAIFTDNTKKIDGIIFRGIQFHSSWNMDPSQQVSMIGDVGNYLMRNLPGHILHNLEFIDIGGGFWPIQGEWLNPRNLSIAKVADALGKKIKFKNMHYYRPSTPIESFAKSIGQCLLSQPKPIRNLELFMEPGRWISHPAMHILLRVIDKKDSNVVITDGGINLLGWERPLTEFIPIINLTRFQLKKRTMRIFGSLCAPEDKWGDGVFGEGILPGDILLVPDQGAYTYSFRQTFIKPVAQVVKYDGALLEQVEKQIV